MNFMIRLIFYRFFDKYICSITSYRKIMVELADLEKNEGCVCRSYKKGQYIYQEGERVNGVHFLINGKVKVLGKYGDKKPLMLWLVDSGSFFGLTSYYHTKENYQYSTEVYSENAEVLHVPEEVFANLLKDEQFQRNMLSSLCNRIDFIETRLAYTNQVDVRKKLLDLVLFLANQRFRYSLTQGSSPVLRYSVVDLANVINTTRKNVRAFINDLVARKVISLNEDGFEITNFDLLRQLR